LKTDENLSKFILRHTGYQYHNQIEIYSKTDVSDGFISEIIRIKTNQIPVEEEITYVN